MWLCFAIFAPCKNTKRKEMTKIHSLCVLATVLFSVVFAGCKSDSEVDAASNSECAVTAVTMATLNRYLPTVTSDGKKTTTKVTVTGSNYPMSIDHLQSRIYNVDSLPAGTDVSRVAFSAFSTSATPMIRSLITLQDSTFVMTDSTDCRKERLITVYAADGMTTHTYKLQVNVHKEWDDTVRWKRICDNEAYLAALNVRRAFGTDDRLYVFGNEGTQPVVLTTPLQTPLAWTRTGVGNGSINTQTIVRCGTSFYALANGLVQESTDGVNWQALTATMPEGITAFKALAVAGSKTIVAVADEGFFSLDTSGDKWEKDAADDVSKMPATDICGVCIPMTGDKNFENLVIVGKRDGKTVVWQRTIDLTGRQSYAWNYVENAETTGVEALESSSAAGYDAGILMAGKASDGKFGDLYISYDKGLTWSKKVIKRPEDAEKKISIGAAESYVLAADAGNFVYVICGGTGEVWRGRINRLGWEEVKKKFTE